MNICWFITILLLLHSCTPGDCIVGGHVSVPHSRPYMVYIQDSKTKSACDGFLVKEDFVMTSAHCKRGHLKVYLGVSDTTLLPTGIEVDSFPHPGFKNKLGNDIMLLKLKTPATLNRTVTIIDLSNPWTDKFLKDCLFMGWGSTKYEHYSPSTVLRELSVTLKNLTNCIEPDVICNEDPSGPSQGDSGGPLICEGIAMGIVSFNEKTTEGYLTGYTRVSQHLQWINEIMKKNNISPRIEPRVHINQKVYKVGRENWCRGIHINQKVYFGVGRENWYRESSKIVYMPKNNKTLTKLKLEMASLQTETC